MIETYHIQILHFIRDCKIAYFHYHYLKQQKHCPLDVDYFYQFHSHSVPFLKLIYSTTAQTFIPDNLVDCIEKEFFIKMDSYIY